MKLIKGGSIGDVYGKAFVRDASGNIVYETEGNNAGLPKVEGDGNTVKVGNSIRSSSWDGIIRFLIKTCLSISW